MRNCRKHWSDSGVILPEAVAGRYVNQQSGGYSNCGLAERFAQDVHLRTAQTLIFLVPVPSPLPCISGFPSTSAT
jgi:hypothetical protein